MGTELNKLRTLSNCFVTTLTYKHPTGITSETDPNGFIKFYEYDQFNRLVLVRDNKNNILKKICYNYSGQPEDCTSPTVYGNQVQSQVFTRNNCGTCEMGSQVTYAVPTNTYTSTESQLIANQMALDDITTNGQNYANTNGTCTAFTGVTITYQNIAAEPGFTVTYSNATLGTYVFTMPTSGSGNLGCVPVGKYSVSITKTPEGIPPLLLFGSGCQYQSGTFSSNFSNVSVSFCHNISIDWDL